MSREPGGSLAEIVVVGVVFVCNATEPTADEGIHTKKKECKKSIKSRRERNRRGEWRGQQLNWELGDGNDPFDSTYFICHLNWQQRRRRTRKRKKRAQKLSPWCGQLPTTKTSCCLSLRLIFSETVAVFSFDGETRTVRNKYILIYCSSSEIIDHRLFLFFFFFFFFVFCSSSSFQWHCGDNSPSERYAGYATK